MTRSTVENLAILRIAFAVHRRVIDRRRVRLPLFSLQALHPIHRRAARAKAARRIRTCAAFRRELLGHGLITAEFLARCLPSRTPVTIVVLGIRQPFVLDGNGRLHALRSVFTPQDGMSIEVNAWTVHQPAKVAALFDRYRDRWYPHERGGLDDRPR